MDATWDAAAKRVLARPYLDPIVAAAKRAEHLALLERWLGDVRGRAVLKTDLWEEAIAGDELLWALEGRGAQVHGIDVSARVVRAARAEAAQRGVPARLDTADVRALPCADVEFDAVVSTSTLDHLPDLAAYLAALRELHRVLRPGGVLVVTADNRANVFDWLLRLAARAGAVPFVLGPAVSAEDLAGMVATAGLQVDAIVHLVPAPRVLATLLVRAARLASGGDAGVRALLTVFAELGRGRPGLSCFVAVRATRPVA